jgi:hypothetical protein
MHEKICDLPTAGENIFRSMAAVDELLIGMNRTWIGRLAQQLLQSGMRDCEERETDM